MQIHIVQKKLKFFYDLKIATFNNKSEPAKGATDRLKLQKQQQRNKGSAGSQQQRKEKHGERKIKAQNANKRNLIKAICKIN